jgi:N-acetylmuramoyl-L-alanine amidase
MMAFRVYEKFDLFRRTKMAEEIRPDATISLHLDGRGRGTKSFTRADGVSVFLPGGLVPGAVKEPKMAFSWLLRMMKEPQMPSRSLGLGISLSKGCQGALDLPATTSATGQDGHWTKGGWNLVNAENAVYARSSVMVLRRIPGLVALVEGFYRNNNEEHLRLLNNDFLVEAWGPFLHRHIFPKRIAEYAQGIFAGLQDYFGSPQE